MEIFAIVISFVIVLALSETIGVWATVITPQKEDSMQLTAIVAVVNFLAILGVYTAFLGHSILGSIALVIAVLGHIFTLYIQRDSYRDYDPTPTDKGHLFFWVLNSGSFICGVALSVASCAKILSL